MLEIDPNTMLVVVAALWAFTLYVSLRYEKLLIGLNFIVSLFLIEPLGIIAIIPIGISIYFMLKEVVNIKM